MEQQDQQHGDLSKPVLSAVRTVIPLLAVILLIVLVNSSGSSTMQEVAWHYSRPIIDITSLPQNRTLTDGLRSVALEIIACTHLLVVGSNELVGSWEY